MDFRDRIVRLDRVPASQIENAPWNMRRHPESQKSALRGSFEELGCFKPLDVYVTDEGMYRLIDGEARRNLIEADVSPDQLIPISVTDLSESEAKKALLIADPLSQLAETDSAALESLMRDVQIADEALAAMVAGMAEDAGIIPPEETTTPVDVEPQTDRAEELQRQWQTAPGQLWEIVGKSGMVHRLLCGDSTKPEDVARVMGGEKADCVLTDPPYAKETHDGARSHKDIDAPSIPFPPIEAQTIRTVIERINPATWIIAFMDWRHVYQLEQQPPIGHRFIRFGVWVKPNSAPQFTGDRPATGWEAIGILHRDGGRMEWNGGGSRAVWTVNKQNEEHPTSKPVELVDELLRLFSNEGDVVADPFLGSGTTLIAAENLGRRCFGLEISPAYCAVILQRCLDNEMQPRLLSPV